MQAGAPRKSHERPLRSRRHTPRRRKLDKTVLVKHVRAHPDALLRERAAEFGVSSVAIFKALRQLQVTKKNDAVRGESFR